MQEVLNKTQASDPGPLDPLVFTSNLWIDERVHVDATTFRIFREISTVIKGFVGLEWNEDHFKISKCAT